MDAQSPPAGQRPQQPLQQPPPPQRPQRLSCIAIRDKTPQMRLLYMSSGARQMLGREPREFIGRSSFDFIEGKVAEDYTGATKGHITEHVLITEIRTRLENGVLRTVQLLRFDCENIVASLALVVRTCMPGTPEAEPQGACNSGSPPRRQAVGVPPTDSQPTSTSRYARSMTKACLVLEDTLHENTDSAAGPQVLFASMSISRILDVDSCELQGMAFLALVAGEDVVAAARFLERLTSPDQLVLDRLRFLHDPTADDRLAPRRTVWVEVLGAGTDDGAIILCQLSRATPSARQTDDEFSGYMSLEDVISSDPDTSDVGDAWR